MNLGIILSSGDSLDQQIQNGQFERFNEYYLKPYSRHFKRVFIFSYGDRGCYPALPENIVLVSKPTVIPGYLYQLILPLVQFKKIKTIDVFRVFQTPGGIPAVVAKIFFKKPYVVTYGYDYVKFSQIESRPILAGLLTLIIPSVLRLASRVIVTDPKNLKFPRAALIPNGVDPLKFKPGKERRSGLVLSVGRLVKQKNYSLLIKAVSLSRLRRRIKLVIVGQGPEETRLIKLAKLKKVSFKIVPAVAHQQLINWYQQAAVFALTSKIEGQPKALLEAMSCACACLTTPFPGNLLKDGSSGLIGGGVEQLSRQLDLLLTDRKLNRRLGNQARQVILKGYNIKPLVEQEINLLKQC